MYLSLVKEFYMQMEYDAFGRVVKGWTPHTVKRATLTDANVDVVIEYDAMGNVITRTDKADDSSSVITTYSYSKAGRLEEEQTDGYTTKNEYDEAGRLEEEQTDGYTTKYEYDEAGRLIGITAPDGVKTYKKYDGSGRLIEEQTGNTNAKTKYVYNPNGTLKAKIDRNGNKTEYEYDCMNQLTKENVSDLIEKTYTYDSLGRKINENDKEKNLREYSYDNLGRVIKEITPEGIELSYTYDARGNVTEYIDGRKTKFVRKYTKTDLLSSEEVFTVKEDDNNYKSTPDASRSYAYDEGGILKQVSEGSKIITYNEKDGSYQSDAYGNIRSMKWSSTGLEMSYEYDNLNRMTSVITPAGKKVDYSYNMNGQVIKLSGIVEDEISYSNSKISEYTLLNGMKKSFEYNDLGLTSSLKYNKNDGDTSISTGFSYTYDDNYNVKTRTSLDTEKLSSFDYDQANRLTNSYMEGEFESKTAEQLTTDNFSYINRDLVGAKQELVKYEALPEEIIFDTSARSYIYEFGGTKEVRAIELYPENKVHRVRERDVHIYVKKSSEGSWVELKNWKFNKDEKNGALKFILKKAVNASSVKVRSVWDDRNVENESIDDYSTFKGKTCNLLRIWTLEDTLQEEYSYDGNSNRIRLVENGNLSSYEYYNYEYYNKTKGGNTAKVRYDGKWYYTYDSNGNRTEKAKKLESNGTINKEQEYWTYEWDLWNRLVKVVQYNAPDNGECVQVSYEYDALNHRIKRTSYDENNKEREVTKYAYGRKGALAYQEKTKDGSVTKRSFTYLNNEIIGFTDKAGEEETSYYTVTDIQGSITEVYDGSSNLVWKSGYTAFGEIAGETVDLIDFDGMYTGCDYDAETGLTYHWNRWRSEDGSSFISEDPARDGANWYGYAGCNPMVYVDKIGLFASNGFLGPYAAEQYNTTPEVGPQPNPNATPQNQTPNITGINNSVDTLEIENDSNLLEQKKDSKTNKLSWQNVKYITFIIIRDKKSFMSTRDKAYRGLDKIEFENYKTGEVFILNNVQTYVSHSDYSENNTLEAFMGGFEFQYLGNVDKSNQILYNSESSKYMGPIFNVQHANTKGGDVTNEFGQIIGDSDKTPIRLHSNFNINEKRKVNMASGGCPMYRHEQAEAFSNFLERNGVEPGDIIHGYIKEYFEP